MRTLRIGEFRNARAEARFRDAYERTFASLRPGPKTALNIPTAFGTIGEPGAIVRNAGLGVVQNRPVLSCRPRPAPPPRRRAMRR